MMHVRRLCVACVLTTRPPCVISPTSLTACVNHALSSCTKVRVVLGTRKKLVLFKFVLLLVVLFTHKL